jgi:hypothetical protein
MLSLFIVRNFTLLIVEGEKYRKLAISLPYCTAEKRKFNLADSLMRKHLSPAHTTILT